MVHDKIKVNIQSLCFTLSCSVGDNHILYKHNQKKYDVEHYLKLYDYVLYKNNYYYDETCLKVSVKPTWKFRDTKTITEIVAEVIAVFCKQVVRVSRPLSAKFPKDLVDLRFG